MQPRFDIHSPGRRALRAALAPLLSALAVSAAFCVSAAPADDDARQSAALQEAQQDYAIGHYAQAFEAFARLADAGHAEAARIAVLMHRYGPRLYGQALTISRERLARWIESALLAAH